MVPTNETTTTKKPDFNKANIKKAIAQGKEMIKSGMSKADVSREIYDLVKDEEKEVIKLSAWIVPDCQLCGALCYTSSIFSSWQVVSTGASTSWRNLFLSGEGVRSGTGAALS